MVAKQGRWSSFQSATDVTPVPWEAAAPLPREAHRITVTAAGLGGGVMRYPRRCRLCRTDYTMAGPAANWQITLQTVPGGTPSRRHPEQPGRRLLLCCLVCGGEYWWDEFGDAGRPIPPAVVGMQAKQPG